MGGQAAEQIIAGVVLSERLAVTMYGAIHRAQFAGQRNLRGLVVDPKMLAESSFRMALTDDKTIRTATGLEHQNIVPTFAVESGGPDVVIVTRGVGRYVTVQDLISAARATRGQAGKLPLPVAAAIGKSVVEALAVAHKANVVHGAVHPRSVLLDEDGAVRLGDFVVGRALTTAVAQGADSSLWRGLAGFIAPELVVGEDPTPAADVFAVGALLFTMLSGEVPPGTLNVTPAVERLVQRALDTDVTRRYKNASDLLENLLEAFEDDRWDIADRGEVIKAAGLSRSDTNIDDATEDLLASLGNSAVQVTPMRPSMDIRAEVVAARHTGTPTTGSGRLDALLADLDDARDHTTVDHTTVDDMAFRRDPISEVISKDPRKREAIVQITPRSLPRVPSLDDPDEDAHEDPTLPPPPRVTSPRPNTQDEDAALNAIAGLDAPVRRVSSVAQQAEAAVEKLESAARRAEAAAHRVETNSDAAELRRSKAWQIAMPNLEEMPDFSAVPTPRLKSRALGIISILVVIGGAVGFYFVYQQQQADRAKQAASDEQRKKDAEDATRRASQAQADRGTITVAATPPDASIWIKLGRTNLDTMPLTSTQMHRIRLELEGYQPIDTEVLPANWAGKGKDRKARINVTLKAVAKDKKTGKPAIEPLPARPPNLAVEPKGFEAGEGPLHIETSPPGAEVWLLIGYPNTGVNFPTVAGRAYELRALSDGFFTGYTSITAEEWRDGGDPNTPIDIAKKKTVIEKRIELQPDPEYKPPAPPKQGK